jgi:CYTH domain-containing protein
MAIDPKIAASLGIARTTYTAVERERRWLCSAVPRERVLRTEAITDLYVTGTQLRLREARPVGGRTPMLRLSRKVDVDARTRLITSIYMTEPEFAILNAALQGVRISKLRHRLTEPSGVPLAVDEFQGALAGLLLLEADFETPDALAAFIAPDFAVREVTDDLRYTGASLAKDGMPDGLAARGAV